MDLSDAKQSAKQNEVRSKMEPPSWDNGVLKLLAFLFVGFWAGLVRAVRAKRFSIRGILAEFSVSGFSACVAGGLLEPTGLLAVQSDGGLPLFGLALVGIVAHMGVQALFVLEQAVSNKLLTALVNEIKR